MGKWGMSESTLRIPIFKIRGTVPINAGRGSTANKCTVVQFNCFKSAPAFLFTLEGQIGKVKNSAPPCQYSTTRYLTCRQKFCSDDWALIFWVADEINPNHNTRGDQGLDVDKFHRMNNYHEATYCLSVALVVGVCTAGGRQ